MDKDELITFWGEIWSRQDKYGQSRSFKMHLSSKAIPVDDSSSNTFWFCIC